MDEKYQCPKWKKAYLRPIWGLVPGLFDEQQIFSRSINAICFRDWTSGDSVDAQILAMLLCPHWWIWSITYILQRTCQFWEPSMWRRYPNYFPWQGTKNRHGQEIPEKRLWWCSASIGPFEHWLRDMTCYLTAISIADWSRRFIRKILLINAPWAQMLGRRKSPVERTIQASKFAYE